MSEIAVGIATGISLAMAALLGVYQPRRINGPARVEAGEQPNVFLTIGGVGLICWGGARLLAASLFSQGAPAAQMSNGQLVLANGLIDVTSLAAMLAATFRLRPMGLQRTGVGFNQLPAGLMGGFVSIVVVLPLIFWVETGSEYLWTLLGQSHPQAHPLLLILSDAHSIWLRAVIVVTAVVLAPLAEEMFFRGQIQTFLRYTLQNPWLAVLITAACFALVHEWWTWPSIFFLGLCLGYAYERTGNLWTCVVLHALFNLASIVLFVHETAPK